MAAFPDQLMLAAWRHHQTLSGMSAHSQNSPFSKISFHLFFFILKIIEIYIELQKSETTSENALHFYNLIKIITNDIISMNI